VEWTLTQYELIMQQLIAHDRHDPTASLPAFLAAWVILLFFRKLKNDVFFTIQVDRVFRHFLHNLVCLFLIWGGHD